MTETTTATRTLTYWVRKLTNTHGVHAVRYVTEAAAQASADRDATTTFPEGVFYDGPIATVSHTYRVGDAVLVQAYGRQREGTVTALGRTRVTVSYIRNAAGVADERPFSAVDVTPAGYEADELAPWAEVAETPAATDEAEAVAELAATTTTDENGVEWECDRFGRWSRAVVRHPYGVGAAALLPSELVPAPGGCVRCLTPEGPRNVHAGWCVDAEILRAAPAFDETDPATWSVPTGRGNEVIENLPACYAWRPVVEAGVETGELVLIAPDGRNLSRAVAEAEVAGYAARVANGHATDARCVECSAGVGVLCRAGCSSWDTLSATELEDDEDGCEGHETLAGAHMGETVYCDGACVPMGRDAAPGLFG